MKRERVNFTPLPAATVQACANGVKGNAPENGTSLENSNGTMESLIADSKSPHETINYSESLPLEQRFITLVEEGLSAWIKAGEVLVEMVQKKGEEAFKSILRECPWMNEPMLWNFYAIGQKKLYPKLLIFSSNQTVARELSALPWSVQREICEKGLPVIEGDRLVRKPITEIDRNDVSIAIEDGRIASLNEQLESKRNFQRPGRSTKPSMFYDPPTPIAPSVPQSLGISTGFYRATLKFGVLSFKKIPKPSIEMQKLVLKNEMGDLCAFVELLRIPSDSN